MLHSCFFPSFFSFLVVISLPPSHSSSFPAHQLLQRKTNADTDAQALTLFRTQTDIHAILSTNWTTSTHPCSDRWLGVRCTADGSARVVALSLPSLDLRGPLAALAPLDQLRILDLRSNRLNSSLHPISSLRNLKLLYLSRNDLSGPIPDDFSVLRRILRLDLSDNNLSGPVPSGLSNLTRLLTLRLQSNALSGQLPEFSALLPGLEEFNVSNNELYGKVPGGLLKKFGAATFSGNAGLCGASPFPVCSFTDSLPAVGPSSSQGNVVPSNPSSEPGSAMPVQRGKSEGRKGLSTTAIVGIVVGDAVVLLVITSFLVAYYCRQRSGDDSRTDAEADDYDAKKRSSSYSLSEKKESEDAAAAEHRSKLVFFDRRKHFELEDLLKASAEMLGKGSLGMVYRAILEDGYMVAVKLLKDANPCARKEFEQYMDIIGKLRHPNFVRLRAYYYAKEEKLLVYDYLPNGSLYSLLHGIEFLSLMHSMILRQFCHLQNSNAVYHPN